MERGWASAWTFGSTEAQISGLALINDERWLSFGLSFVSSEAQISEFAIICNEKWLSFGLNFGSGDKTKAHMLHKSILL